MILDFTISNFRSIREAQTLSFEATNDKHLSDYFVVEKGKYRILKIAAILGANASGKSNIVQAFYLLPKLFLRPCSNKTSKIKYDKFALDDDFASRDSDMIVNFIVGETKYRYEVSFNNDMVTREQCLAHPFGALRPRKVFDRVNDPEKAISTIKWGEGYCSASDSRILQGNLLHNRTVFGAFQSSNVSIPVLDEIVKWLDSYFLPAINTSDQHLDNYTSEQIIENKIKKEEVSDLLKFADIGVDNLQIEKKEEPIPEEVVSMLLLNEKIPEEFKSELKKNPKPVSTSLNVQLFHHGANGVIKPFDFDKESSGTQRYYALSSILIKMVEEPHFLAIDELENKLHPDLYEHFLITYLSNARESQLVYTTHIREFLDDRNKFRDDSVWFTEKSEEGATTLYSMADFGSDTIRDTTNRYNAYRSGRLGAIPHLGSTYINKKD